MNINSNFQTSFPAEVNNQCPRIRDSTPRSGLSRSGFGILELVIASGIMLIISSAVMTLIFNFQKEIKRSELQINIADLSLQVRNALANELAWAATVANNPSMNCIRNGTSCTSRNGVWANFSVYTQGNNLIYQGASATSGFLESGAFCNTWVAANSNDCPLRLNLRWSPSCDTTGMDPTCINPSINVRGNYLYTASEERKLKPINLSKYDFEYTIQTNVDLARRLCTDMGGTYNTASLNCEMTAVNNLINEVQILKNQLNTQQAAVDAATNLDKTVFSGGAYMPVTYQASMGNPDEIPNCPNSGFDTSGMNSGDKKYFCSSAKNGAVCKADYQFFACNHHVSITPTGDSGNNGL